MEINRLQVLYRRRNDFEFSPLYHCVYDRSLSILRRYWKDDGKFFNFNFSFPLTYSYKLWKMDASTSWSSDVGLFAGTCGEVGAKRPPTCVIAWKATPSLSFSLFPLSPQIDSVSEFLGVDFCGKFLLGFHFASLIFAFNSKLRFYRNRKYELISR